MSNANEWKPKPRAAASFGDVKLTGEEGFVLSRIDGNTSLTDLTHLTGLPKEKVSDILDRLGLVGLVDDTPAKVSTSLRTLDDQAPVVTAEEAIEEARALLDDMSEDDDEPVRDTQVPHASHGADANAADDDAPGDSPTDDEETDNAQSEELDVAEEGNFRKLYAMVFSERPVDEREKIATTTNGANLMALCFDPVPSVIARMFENPKIGFAHARLIARHHRTPHGLDVVLGRSDIARDAQVQRNVLQNPMAQDTQLTKILRPKRMGVVYKWALSRDLPERNRNKTKNVLRSQYSTAPAEDRADLVFSTEGRCLTMLIGIPFDSHTTALMCGRTYSSNLLVLNLCRFSSTPPNLLTHLMKQNLVRRSPQLKTMVLQHPNCPSELKRRG
jgi:hypothetical protein